MKLKSIFSSALILIVFSSVTLLAQEQEIKNVSSKINNATVFLRGAELTHTASSSLSKGDNIIKITGLSPSLDRNSMNIKASNGVIISSFEFTTEELPVNRPNESKIKLITDTIENLNTELNRLKASMKIDTEVMQLMKKGTDRNVADTIKVAELIKVLDYYQTKATDIEMKQIAGRLKQQQLEKKIADVNTRLRKESNQEFQTSGVLKLNLSAPLAITCNFTVSYFTPLAQWTPYYDINIKSIDQPINIVAKAKVRQTTTVDWKNVKLTLSTSTPSKNRTAPLFNTWFLSFVTPSTSYGYVAPAAQNSISYEKESSDINKALQGKVAGVQIRGSSSIQSSEPLYVVDGNIVDASYVSVLDADRIKEMQVLKDASATSIYGSRGANGVVVITTKTAADYVSENEGDLDLNYSVDLPYTIPGDGNEQSISLQTKQTNATYKYYCAPKLDNQTFIVAEISNAERLNLQSGKANITFNEMYVGETFINPNSTQNNLSLTLGAEKRVSVKRELLQDFSSKKTFGNSITQVFTYKITVKNNLNKTIKMVVKDQYPKSTNSEIEVTLLTKETTTPTFNKEDVGVLTWEEDFKAGETKEYRISYSVKYPKDKTLNLE